MGNIIPELTEKEHAIVNGIEVKKVAIINPDGNQSQIDSLIETLQELTIRLTAIAATVANTQQLRVVQASVPSTAVTGPITSANSIAEKAVGGISYAEKMAITNLTAIQSNVNNCIGK